MNVADTIMVGRLGPSAIGAIAVGGSTFYAFAIFGMGLLLGLDTLVSQAFGAGDHDGCIRSLTTGIYLALFLAPILNLFFYLIPSFFGLIGINRNVSTLEADFIRALSLSTTRCCSTAFSAVICRRSGMFGPLCTLWSAPIW